MIGCFLYKLIFNQEFSLNQEETIWSGSPSQIVNLGTFIFCTLTVILLPIAFWKWLVIKNTKYELTNQRLKISRGVLNKRRDDLELYRIKDYIIQEPLFLRLFSLGNLRLETSDKSNKILTIRAVPNTIELKDTIRTLVETIRVNRRVQELDIDQL